MMSIEPPREVSRRQNEEGALIGALVLSIAIAVIATEATHPVADRVSVLAHEQFFRYFHRLMVARFGTFEPKYACKTISTEIVPNQGVSRCVRSR